LDIVNVARQRYKKMKVVLSGWRVFPFHGYGGLEKYPYYLGKYLQEEGVDVKIVTSLSKDNKRSLEYDGIKYVFLCPMIVWKKLWSPWILLYSLSLAKHLKKEKCDILHSFENTAYAYLHFKNRVPTLTQPFGIEPFTAPPILELRNIKKLYIDVMGRHPLRYCISHADAVISEADFQIKSLLELGAPKEKIFNLPVGINLSYIKEKLEDIKLSRKDLGLNESDFVLISVNRFHPDKGLGYLVDAFNLLNEKLDDIKLILIGGVENERERAEYKKVVNQLREYKLMDKTIIAENVSEDDLYDYYALSDVYVSPTLQDDYIMSIQEAMACGLPIVSTGQDFLVKSGVNGYVVSKRDPYEMAKAVLKIYDENKCGAMGAKSKEMAEKYGFESIAKNAIQIYEKLLEK